MNSLSFLCLDKNNLFIIPQHLYLHKNSWELRKVSYIIDIVSRQDLGIETYVDYCHVVGHRHVIINLVYDNNRACDPDWNDIQLIFYS